MGEELVIKVTLLLLDYEVIPTAHPTRRRPAHGWPCEARADCTVFGAARFSRLGVTVKRRAIVTLTVVDHDRHGNATHLFGRLSSSHMKPLNDIAL